MTTKKSAPVKKVAAKVAQKVASKKVSATKGKKTLVCAGGEEAFWVNDGKILINLVELKDALASMDESVFAHHVAKDRNDFADWIEHVLQDAELATTFRKSKKSNTARDVVVSRLRIYSI